MAASNIINPYEQIWKTRDLRALNTPVEIDNKLPEWRRGLGAFGKEMQATGYGLVGLGAQGVENLIGENAVTSGLTDWGIEGYNKAIQESQSGLNAPSVAQVEDIKNASDAMDWAGYQLGKGIPMLGSLALSGGIGGAVARIGANQGVKALAKSAVGDLVKKTVATKAIQAAEGQVVTQAMKQAAATALRDTFAKGAIAGGYAGSFGLEGGLAFGEQVAEGVNPADAVKSAIAVAGINGALEFLPFYSAAKSIGMGSYAKKSIAKVITDNPELSKRAIGLAAEVGGRALKGAAVGAGAEGITEGLQELVSIAGLRWAENEPLFADLTPEDWGRIKNAAAAGALVGGVAMGAGATVGGPQTQETAPPPAGTPPAQTGTPPVTPPTDQTRTQDLEAMRSRIDAALAEAQAAGDTAGVEELQQIKARFDSELGVETPVQGTPVQVAPVQEAPVETPPVIQTVPPTQEVTPPVRETPLDIPPAPPTTQPPVPPRPGETVQLKRGEEVILTPPGQPETRVVPTEEEKANLQQLLGERPIEKPINPTQPEVIPNAEEVQTQTEAPVDTRFSMPRRKGTKYTIKAYHGTPNDTFAEFDAKELGKNSGNTGLNGAGFYFTPDKETASSYGKNVISASLELNNPLITEDFAAYEGNGASGEEFLAAADVNFNALGSVFDNNPELSVEQKNIAKAKLNEFKTTGMGGELLLTFMDVYKEAVGPLEVNDAPTKLSDMAKQAGYDGITANYNGEPLEIVVFDPKQIKKSKDRRQPNATEATMEEFEAVRKQFQDRQAQETPFKNWFGKGTPGVTADSAGTPITLYHGTNNPTFNQWDSSRAGEASKHPTSGLGFFMTADKGAAARYGNNLMALHAKIQNPYELTDADLTSIETKEDAAKLRKKLMAKGYDGAVVKAPGAKPYVIAFDSKQVKFVTNDKPTDSADFRYSMPKGRFYSGLSRAVEGLSQKKASGAQWASMLDNMVSKGQIKKEELDWMGVNEWLKEQGVASKEDVLKFIKVNEVNIKELELGVEGRHTRNTDWTLRGGKNQRELIISVPNIEPYTTDTIHYGDTAGGRAVVWVRINDRTDEDGKKVLFIEEIQSKRHQEGSKQGYDTDKSDFNLLVESVDQRLNELGIEPSVWLSEEDFAKMPEDLREDWDIAYNLDRPEPVPNAPFKQTISGSSSTLSGWAGLAFKRMLRYAAENGYDRVGFTTGEQQAERYKQAGRDYLINLYDRQLPKEINKYVKKWEAKVGTTQIDVGAKQPATVHSVDVTSAMKESIMQGQPLFSFAGPRALIADLIALETAEKRIALGDNAEVVRQETGWHQGADKKWRFEISDKDMKWKQSFDSIPESEIFKDEKAIPLSEVIDHPKLFAAYPFLEAIKLIKRKALFDVEQRTQGYFSDDKLEIIITPYAKDPLSTILHEIQHAIQMYEGFARGGNESSVWESLPVETKENVAKGVIEKLNEKVAKEKEKLDAATLLEKRPDLIIDYNDATTKRDKAFTEYQAYEKRPFKDPERQQKSKIWMAEIENVERVGKLISKFLGEKDTPLSSLSFEKYNTVVNFIRFLRYNNADYKKEITKHKFKLNVEITDLLDKIAAIRSGDEKAIRAEANLYEFYKKLAGETEARLTQARQDMTEEERKERSPQSMQEYPDEDQIVVMQGRQSLSAEQGSPIRSVTPDELRANVNSVMGENWIQQAEAAGIIEVIDGAGTRGESGSWAGDKFRLYTQTMPADGSPLGVLLHEGSHAPTFNEILGDSLGGYLKDLDTLAENGNETARNAIAQATIAVADVLGIKHNLMQGGNKTDLKNVQALIEERKPGLLAEEKLAYFIQYAAETKDGAGFLKRLINAIKAWFAQTQLGQALKEAGIGFELNEAMAVEWAKASLRNSLAEAQQAARIRELVIAEAKEMPPSVRLGRALEAQYSVAPEGTLQDIPEDSLTDSDVRYSLGLQEFKDTLWTDPTDSRQDFVNKPGLLQKFRANFIDFFAEMEKKSTRVYDAYSLLRNKKAARLVQARQEYMFPLRDLIAKGPWTSKEVGDMLAARHHKVDNVNTQLAERSSYNYTKELLRALPVSKKKELMKARVNVKAGKMPDGSIYLDANGTPTRMAKTTKQKLMFDLMNKYVVFEQLNPDGKQALRFEWEVFKDAAGGFSNGGIGKGIVRSIDDVLAGTSKDQARFDRIANLFDAMNRHALQIREDGELITPEEHARLLLDKTAYAPLRRESYNVDREIEQLFQHAGQGGSKQLGVRTGTTALSEPTLVLQNALAALEASAAAAERNLANKELYAVVNADKEGWKPWFAIVDADKYMTHDEDGFLQERNATASNRADITLINKGKKLVIRPNMHNERAMGFVRAANNLDAQIISGPMSVLNFFNNIVRWVNVTASPAFLMMNAIRDPGTAFYNLQATEAAPYTSEIFANYSKSFKALKKVFLDGNRDPTDADVKMVEAFENAGGRTSFIEQLNPSDDTWRSFDAQVARRQGSMKQIMAAKDKWIDGLENFNVLFENVMRLSTFNVLTNKGVDKTRAARIAQDLTTNFTRRGYKTQALGNWWVFFNAAVQGNYQVLRNLMASKKLQAWAGGTIMFALMLDLLGRAVADDWDEIPEWDKERFIILPVKVAGDFVKIPAPWVYNVLWRAGGMFGEALAGVRKPQNMVLDLAALTAVTFSPLGKPGSIAQLISPTAADPFVQILENKDFAGNPIGPEGFPGAGNKANSELLWSSTPKGYQSVARFVNEWTGGSAVESGAIDLRPGDYQLLAKFLTGSLGRFLSDATFGLQDNLEKGIEGPKEIPIVKEFFSEPYNPMRSQTYHTNIAAVYGAHKLEKMYREGPERDLVKLQEVRQARGKDLRMYSQAQDVERQIKSLRVRIRAAENRKDNARVKDLRGRMEDVQERFNAAYKQRVG